MKTLKKTLCLVLAVVLALGVMVVPAYADKSDYDAFKDLDDVDYKYEEALATLTGMGIVSGKDGGKVYPTAYITRAEAVTLLARAVLGPKEAEKLPDKSSGFSDVPAGNFARKYIAWAAEQNIVAGKGNNMFCPNEIVTGYEMAKMALVAADIYTDFKAESWQVTTVDQASAAKLLDGLDVANLNNTLTRQESAQVLWQMIKYAKDPESIKVEVVHEDNTKDTVTVTYPTTDCIGGKVYGLTQKLTYEDDSQPTDDFNRPTVEWSNGKTDYTKVIYSEIKSRALTMFYAGASLTAADLISHLGLTSVSVKGKTFRSYVNGNTVHDKFGHLDVAKPAEETVLASTSGVLGVSNVRGAEVYVYPAVPTSAGTPDHTYDVYVIYPFATAIKTAPTDNKATLTWDYTGTASTGSGEIPAGLLRQGDVVTFNVSYKTTTAGVVRNQKSEAPTMSGVVTERNPDSANPYIRINHGEKLYFSAKAVKISQDGTTISSIDWTTITLDGANYNVWLDNAGNILALKVANPSVTYNFDDFGYVLEFSCKAGQQTEHVHGNEYGTEKACKTAEAQVVMVSLKTGAVAIYQLKVLQEGAEGAERWFIADFNGKKDLNGYEITATLNGVTDEFDGNGDPRADASILHGFVAFKNLGDGKYGMTRFNRLTSSTMKYTYVDTFETSVYYPGRITLNGTDYLYANEDTQLYVLNGHTPVADGSYVNSYKVTELKNYAALGSVHTNTTKMHHTSTRGDGDREFLGTGALFIHDPKTNMVQTAYIFGIDSSFAMNDLYIYLGREESVLGQGTKFNFVHNGEVVQIPVKAVNMPDMLLKLDNNLDATGYPVLTFRLTADGYIDVATVADVNSTVSEVAMFQVDGFVKDGYIADGATMYYLADGCYVFDAATGKVVENPTSEWMKGKNVYLYYAEAQAGYQDPELGTIAIIWVETAPAKHVAGVVTH